MKFVDFEHSVHIFNQEFLNFSDLTVPRTCQRGDSVKNKLFMNFIIIHGF